MALQPAVTICSARPDKLAKMQRLPFVQIEPDTSFNYKFIEGTITKLFPLSTAGKSKRMKIILREDEVAAQSLSSNRINVFLFGGFAEDFVQFSEKDKVFISEARIEKSPTWTTDGVHQCNIIVDRKHCRPSVWVIPKERQSRRARINNHRNGQNSTAPSEVAGQPVASASSSVGASAQGRCQSARQDGGGGTSGADRAAGQGSTASASGPASADANRRTTSAVTSATSCSNATTAGHAMDAWTVPGSSAPATARSYTYTSFKHLKEISQVNVFGIVKFFKPPYKTRGPDYTMTVTLVDPTLDPSHRGLRCQLFRDRIEGLPQVHNVGDIVRFHRLKISRYNGELQGLAGIAFQSLAFDGEKDASLDPRSSTPNFTLTEDDVKRVKELRLWSSRQTQLAMDNHSGSLAKMYSGQYFDLTCQVVSVATLPAERCTVVRVWDGTHYRGQVRTMDITSTINKKTNAELARKSEGYALDVSLYDNHMEPGSMLNPGQYIKICNLHVVRFRPPDWQEDNPEMVELVVHHGTSYGRGIILMKVWDQGIKDLIKRMEDAVRTDHARNIQNATATTSGTVPVDQQVPMHTLAKMNSGQYFDLTCQVVSVATLPAESCTVVRVWDGTHYRGQVRTMDITSTINMKTNAELARKSEGYALDVSLYDNHMEPGSKLNPGQYIKICNLHVVRFRPPDWQEDNPEMVELVVHHGTSYGRGIILMKVWDQGIKDLIKRMEDAVRTDHARNIQNATATTSGTVPVDQQVPMHTLAKMNSGQYFDLTCQVVSVATLPAESCTVVRVWDGTHYRGQVRTMDITSTINMKTNAELARKSEGYALDVSLYDNHMEPGSMLNPGQYIKICNLHVVRFRPPDWQEDNPEMVELVVHHGTSYGRGVILMKVWDQRVKDLIKRMEDAVRTDHARNIQNATATTSGTVPVDQQVPMYTLAKMNSGQYFDLTCQVVSVATLPAESCTVVRVWDGTHYRGQVRTMDITSTINMKTNAELARKSEGYALDVSLYDNHMEPGSMLNPGQYIKICNLHVVRFRPPDWQEDNPEMVELVVHHGTSYGRGIILMKVWDQGIKDLIKRMEDAVRTDHARNIQNATATTSGTVPVDQQVPIYTLAKMNSGQYFDLTCQVVSVATLPAESCTVVRVWDGTHYRGQVRTMDITSTINMKTNAELARKSEGYALDVSLYDNHMEPGSMLNPGQYIKICNLHVVRFRPPDWQENNPEMVELVVHHGTSYGRGIILMKVWDQGIKDLIKRMEDAVRTDHARNIQNATATTSGTVPVDQQVPIYTLAKMNSGQYFDLTCQVVSVATLPAESCTVVRVWDGTHYRGQVRTMDITSTINMKTNAELARKSEGYALDVSLYDNHMEPGSMLNPGQYIKICNLHVVRFRPPDWQENNPEMVELVVHHGTSYGRGIILMKVWDQGIKDLIKRMEDAVRTDHARNIQNATATTSGTVPVDQQVPIYTLAKMNSGQYFDLTCQVVSVATLPAESCTVVRVWDGTHYRGQVRTMDITSTINMKTNAELARKSEGYALDVSLYDNHMEPGSMLNPGQYIKICNLHVVRFRPPDWQEDNPEMVELVVHHGTSYGRGIILMKVWDQGIKDLIKRMEDAVRTDHARNIQNATATTSGTVPVDQQVPMYTLAKMNSGQYFDLTCQVVSVATLPAESCTVVRVWDGTHYGGQVRTMDITSTINMKTNAELARKSEGYALDVSLYDNHMEPGSKLNPGQYIKICNLHVVRFRPPDWQEDNPEMVELVVHHGTSYGRGIILMKVWDQGIKDLIKRMEDAVRTDHARNIQNATATTSGTVPVDQQVPMYTLAKMNSGQYFDLTCQVVSVATLPAESCTVVRVWDGTHYRGQVRTMDITSTINMKTNAELARKSEGYALDVSLYDNHMEPGSMLNPGQYIKICNLHVVRFRPPDWQEDNPEMVELVVHHGTSYGRGIILMKVWDQGIKDLIKRVEDAVRTDHARNIQNATATTSGTVPVDQQVPMYTENGQRTAVIGAASAPGTSQCISHQSTQQLASVITDHTHQPVTAIREVLKSEPPNKFRVIAKVKDYLPHSVVDFVRLCCPRCKFTCTSGVPPPQETATRAKAGPSQDSATKRKQSRVREATSEKQSPRVYNLRSRTSRTARVDKPSQTGSGARIGGKRGCGKEDAASANARVEGGASRHRVRTEAPKGSSTAEGSTGRRATLRSHAALQSSTSEEETAPGPRKRQRGRPGATGGSGSKGTGSDREGRSGRNQGLAASTHRALRATDWDGHRLTMELLTDDEEEHQEGERGAEDGQRQLRKFRVAITGLSVEEALAMARLGNRLIRSSGPTASRCPQATPQDTVQYLCPRCPNGQQPDEEATSTLLQYKYCLKLILDDGTGSIEVNIKRENAEIFFRGLKAVNLHRAPGAKAWLEKRMTSLCPLPAWQLLDEDDDPVQGAMLPVTEKSSYPWLECCVMSYPVSLGGKEVIKYMMFDTALAI